MAKGTMEFNGQTMSGRPKNLISTQETIAQQKLGFRLTSSIMLNTSKNKRNLAFEPHRSLLPFLFREMWFVDCSGFLTYVSLASFNWAGNEANVSHVLEAVYCQDGN